MNTLFIRIATALVNALSLTTEEGPFANLDEIISNLDTREVMPPETARTHKPGQPPFAYAGQTDRNYWFISGHDELHLMRAVEGTFLHIVFNQTELSFHLLFECDVNDDNSPTIDMTFDTSEGFAAKINSFPDDWVFNQLPFESMEKALEPLYRVYQAVPEVIDVRLDPLEPNILDLVCNCAPADMNIDPIIHEPARPNGGFIPPSELAV